MRALWFEGGKASLREVEGPERRPGEVLLGLRVAAIDPSTLALAAGGRFTGIPGGEAIAGVIDSDDPAEVGIRVLVRPSVPCGSCRYCLRGEATRCRLPLSVGSAAVRGVLSERFSLPRAAVLPLPAAVRDYDGVMAYGLAPGLALWEEAQRSRRLLVMGEGPRPPVVAIGLPRGRCEVYLTVADEARAERMKRFGILRDPGGLFPLVICCSARPETVADALRRAEPGGRVLLHLPEGASAVVDLADAMRREVSAVGLGVVEPASAFERLTHRETCEALSKARDEAFPLSRAEEALAAARVEGAFQILVDNLDGAAR